MMCAPLVLPPGAGSLSLFALLLLTLSLSPRNYFDFVRVRNLLTTKDVSFAVNSEYTSCLQGRRTCPLHLCRQAQARATADGSRALLLPPLRGVRMFFYSLMVRSRAPGLGTPR